MPFFYRDGRVVSVTSNRIWPDLRVKLDPASWFLGAYINPWDYVEIYIGPIAVSFIIPRPPRRSP